MAEVTGRETEFKGRYGRSLAVPVPDIPAAAETVCIWLLTAPQAHPLWAQYMLGCVRLRDLEGFPSPKRQFDGATHEINLVALHPDYGPYTVEKMEGYCRDGGGLRYLTPVNIAHQIEGSDDEARLLAAYAAMGVANGLLWPETADAPDRVRAGWDSVLVKTLAHIRGEVHAP